MSCIGFLQDHNGNNSTMRLMCLIALIGAIGGMFASCNPIIVTALISAAFGAKTWQKQIEINNATSN